MKRRFWRILALVLAPIVIIVIILALTFIKTVNHYRPSVYNYESYLSPKIINRFKKSYNYKEYHEVSEFTQALYQDKAIAGVGSDFQAAQLMLDNKIRPINFEILFGSNFKNWEQRKALYRPDIVKHIEEYDNLLEKKAKATNKENYLYYGHYDNNINQYVFVDPTTNLNVNESQKVRKHLYDFIIPYYSQDKGVAFNINKEIRPHLNVDKALEQLENQDQKLSWTQILDILKANNYQHIGWTNAYLDNLMLGAFYNGNNEPNVFDQNNYKQAINKFVEFVEHSSNKSIKNTHYNFFSNDGLELLNHLIEPKPNRSDAIIAYNGDALDAYYSEDNFQSVPDGSIRFIRPKDNYLLMDAWIISNQLSDEATNDFLKVLRDNIYSTYNLNIYNNLDQSTELLENLFFKEIANNLPDQQDFIDEYQNQFLEEFQNKQEEIKASLAKIDNERIKTFFDEISSSPDLIAQKVFNLFQAFKENNQQQKLINKEILLFIRNNDINWVNDFIEDMFGDSELGELSNFDYISYTPVDKTTYEFIKKWYFANDEIALSIYEQPEENENYKVYSYPLIDSRLRNQIIAYYYEQTKS